MPRPAGGNTACQKGYPGFGGLLPSPNVLGVSMPSETFSEFAATRNRGRVHDRMRPVRRLHESVTFGLAIPRRLATLKNRACRESRTAESFDGTNRRHQADADRLANAHGWPGSGRPSFAALRISRPADGISGEWRRPPRFLPAFGPLGSGDPPAGKNFPDAIGGMHRRYGSRFGRAPRTAERGVRYPLAEIASPPAAPASSPCRIAGEFIRSCADPR